MATRALTLINGIPRMADITASIPTYVGVYTVGVGGLAANTDITLPSSGSYTDIELHVFWDGQLMIAGIDYTYVGSGTRTKIQMTFALLANETIQFCKY